MIDKKLIIEMLEVLKIESIDVKQADGFLRDEAEMVGAKRDETNIAC